MTDNGTHQSPEEQIYYTSKRRRQRKKRREEYLRRKQQNKPKSGRQEVEVDLEPYIFVIKLGIMVIGFIILASVLEMCARSF
jgi:hypothetical protein